MCFSDAGRHAGLGLHTRAAARSLSDLMILGVVLALVEAVRERAARAEAVHEEAAFAEAVREEAAHAYVVLAEAVPAETAFAEPVLPK